MCRRLDDIVSALPARRHIRIERRAQELASLKDLRVAVEQTREDLAAAQRDR